jgi:type IV secretory pathway VirB10-like protein
VAPAPPEPLELAELVLLELAVLAPPVPPPPALELVPDEVAPPAPWVWKPQEARRPPVLAASRAQRAEALARVDRGQRMRPW